MWGLHRAFLAFGLVGVFGLAIPATAGVCLSESGSRAYISGEIEMGDEKKFEEFLGKIREKPLKVVFLEGYGGSLGASVLIGRMIRKAKLSTAMRADRALCESACTMIFAGGVQRYYINGQRISDGFSSRGGLGYHPSHTRDPSRMFGTHSDRGTQAMGAYYREMGAPRAIELASQAAFNTIYRPSGKTALEMKIATSLAEPPD